MREYVTLKNRMIYVGMETLSSATDYLCLCYSQKIDPYIYTS